jgi:TRAP-type mannitol/chloroaromatic compound transport system permease large subunit
VLIVLADQLGRSVGDMYAGAILPGLVLTGLYMGYVFVVSMLRPDWVPALPPEARTLGHGVTSLLVAILVCIGIGYGAHVMLVPLARGECRHPGRDGRGSGDLSLCRDGQGLKLNTLSRLAQQVDHRADPAAGAGLPGARNDLPWHRHPDRGRRDGGAWRDGAGGDEAAAEPMG